jgi:hypothetical protein
MGSKGEEEGEEGNGKVVGVLLLLFSLCVVVV